MQFINKVHTNAIPKTSIKFVKFFAHQNNICETNPETMWHKLVKRIISYTLNELGYQPQEEKQGLDWIADVFIEIDSREIAFEIQRSPQTLEKYLERTKKYTRDNIEVFWILPEKEYMTLNKAITYQIKENIKKMPTREKRSEFIKNGIFPILEGLQAFKISETNLNIQSVGLFDHTLQDFLIAIFNKNLVLDRAWKIIGKEKLPYHITSRSDSFEVHKSSKEVR